jgi:hypothetical protein
MDNIVAAARQARTPAGFDAIEQIRDLMMCGCLFEAACAQMAMQAFAVVVR